MENKKFVSGFVKDIGNVGVVLASDASGILTKIVETCENTGINTINVGLNVGARVKDSLTEHVKDYKKHAKQKPAGTSILDEVKGYTKTAKTSVYKFFGAKTAKEESGINQIIGAVKAKITPNSK